MNKTTRLAKSAPAAPDTHIFAQLSKVDVQNRIVYGRAVQEVPDASGEIFDYKSSKPYFEKWVDETKEASGGKSLGNIRAMHGNVAAGKAVEVTFQDDECAIDIAAKVVDDNEWEKVLEGIYTGFSIGGAYVGKKVPDGDLMRYTAAPIEISLVDKPCIPTAMFFDVVKSKGYTVVKVDGKEEHREFKLEAEKPVDPAPVEKVEEVEIVGKPEDVKAFGVLMKASGITLDKVVEMVKSQIKVEAPKRFADAANKKYPLDNNEQVLAAWYFVNTAKAATAYDAPALEAIKAEVISAYKERFEAEPEAVDAEKALAAFGDEGALLKSFYPVASAASMLQSLSYFLEDMRYWEDADVVSEGSLGKITTCVQVMGQVIADMIASEAAKITADESAGMQLSLKAALEGFAKSITTADEKKMKKRIQKAHDMMVEAGAMCAAGKSAEDELNKVANVDLKKQLDELTTRFEKFMLQPQTPKAVLRVVGKGDETAPLDTVDPLTKSLQDMTAVLGPDGKPDMAATLIKYMHRAGGQPARP